MTAPKAPQRPLRVAILDHTGELGGAELALVRLLDALAPRADVEAHVILFADGPLVSRLRDGGHSVEVLPLRADVARAERHAVGGSARAVAAAAAGATPFVRRLAARLRALDVDVVHTTSLKADLLGVPAARFARRRSCGTCTTGSLPTTCPPRWCG
ncbi:hypothetical protein [Janibacter sp. G56]|uniref:hypothetical protein n=1 Tax=Janibacter sp. G56 TaxID=3418717 RepID=UPI003D03F61C